MDDSPSLPQPDIDRTPQTLDLSHTVRKVDIETIKDIRRFIVADRREELVYKISESEISALETSITKISPASRLFHTLWSVWFGVFVTALFSLLFANDLSKITKNIGYSILALSAFLTALCFYLDRREGDKIVASRQDALDTLQRLKALYSDPRDLPGNQS
jgi:hypothetical protein